MNKTLKTVLISLQIFLVIGTIYFLFKRKKANEVTDEASGTSVPNADPQEVNTSDDGTAMAGPATNGYDDSAMAGPVKESSTNSKSYTGVKPPVVRPANIDISNWNPTTKSFQYTAVYNGFIEVGTFAPGEAPVDKKMGVGRMLIVQGLNADDLVQRIIKEPAVLKAVVTDVATKSGATKVTPQTVIDSGGLSAKDVKLLADAQKYATHSGNKVLLDEMARTLHSDIEGLTSNSVVLAVFNNQYISGASIVKLLILDFNTGVFQEAKL